MEVAMGGRATLGVPSDEHVTCLAARYGTPFYVYDMRKLRQRVDEIRRALAPAQAHLYFATMANDRPEVLGALSALGVGACVNSLPHLALARDAGFPVRLTQFTSTGTARRDLAALLALDVKTNLDSLSQLSTWFELGARRAAVRVNAASLGGGVPDDRIGLERSQLASALSLASHSGGGLEGVHLYVGTNYQQPEPMLPTLDAFFRLAEDLPQLAYVNIGGGIGVDYAHRGPGFDIRRYGEEIARFSRRLRSVRGHDVDVIVEPGRGLVAGCGTLVTSVTDVKQLAGRRYVAVDASIAIFPRPFHHPESPHRIRELGRKPGPAGSDPLPATIVGRTTFSRDVLGQAAVSPAIEPGSLLVFDDAGAYSQSMMSRFLGQPQPETVILDEHSDPLTYGSLPASTEPSASRSTS